MFRAAKSPTHSAIGHAARARTPPSELAWLVARAFATLSLVDTGLRLLRDTFAEPVAAGDAARLIAFVITATPGCAGQIAIRP